MNRFIKGFVTVRHGSRHVDVWKYYSSGRKKMIALKFYKFYVDWNRDVLSKTIR